MQSLIEKIEKFEKILNLDPLAKEYVLLLEKLRNALHLIQVNSVYLFAETADNFPISKTATLNLIRNNVSSNILIPGGEDANGFPGYAKWSDFLEKSLKTSKVTISPLDMGKNSNNVATHTESYALKTYLENQGADYKIIIVAPLFHVLRAYATLISSITDLKQPIQVFPYSIPKDYSPVEWGRTTNHSQGRLGLTTETFFIEELVKTMGVGLPKEFNPSSIPCWEQSVLTGPQASGRSEKITKKYDNILPLTKIIEYMKTTFPDRLN